MEMLNKVQNILRELSGSTDINPSDELQSDLGLDSLQLVTLLIMIEDSFGIVLEESDMNPFYLTNVSSIIKLVEKYIGDSTDEVTKEES